MKRACSANRKRLKILPLLLALLLLGGCAGVPPQRQDGPDGTAAAASGETDFAVWEERIETCPVTESKHDREEDYLAVFKTYQLSLEPFSLHMESRIYDESRLRADARTLLHDLEALEEAAGVRPAAVTVYLVKETLGDRPKAVGTQVFSTPEDLESGACREVLCAAAFALPSVWQRAGLTELVFGAGPHPDLAAYYAQEEHALTASCSALHLSPDLSGGETASAARETARSLTAFLLDTAGFSAFRSAEDPASVLPSWSESLGLSPTPRLLEGSSWAAGLTLESKKGCLCVMRTENFCFVVTEESWITDADDLYRWVCSFFAGMDMVLEQIRAEAPSAARLAEERFAEPVTVRFLDSMSVTCSYPDRNLIDLTKPDAVWHEMVHLLLEETVVRSGQGWQEEALAEHFCYQAETRFAPTRYYSEGYDAYLRFFAEESGREASGDDLLFHQSVWNLYQLFRAPDRTGTDDVEAYCRAYGICSLLLDGTLERTQVRQKYDLSVADKRTQPSGSKELDGEALSYPESLVVFEYLAETCGMDPAVEAFLNGVPLEQAFGIRYPELFLAARDSYAQRYGDQLASE